MARWPLVGEGPEAPARTNNVRARLATDPLPSYLSKTMTTPKNEKPAIEHYALGLAIVADRLNLLAALPDEPNYLNAEQHALHIRKIVEGIAFVALSAFEHQHGVMPKWRKMDAQDVLAELEKRGLLQLPRAQNPNVRPYLVPRPSHDLGAEDLRRAFSLASQVLHERHPARMNLDTMKAAVTELRSYASRLRAWLWTCVVFLNGEGFIVQMSQVWRENFILRLTRPAGWTATREAAAP